MRIGYVGNDQRFIDHLKSVFKEKVGDDVEYIQLDIHEDFVPAVAFKSLYDQKPDIIYIDLFFEPAKGLSLCKLLCRNNETRLISTVLIHDQNEGMDSLIKGVLSGARLNFYKSAEPEEVVAHPLMLIDASFDSGDEYAAGTNLKGLFFKQILRIGYVAEDHYRIETNCKLKEESIVQLDTHPLSFMMPSKRFLVEKFSDSDLYYNQRFSYNLRFTYIDDEFFRASEQSWVNYKKTNLRKKLNLQERKDLPYVLEDVEERVRLYQPVKDEVNDWLQENAPTVVPKQLKVLVVDESLEIFEEYAKDPKNFPFSINFQTKLSKDFYQIKRFRPHLILIHMEEGSGGLETLKQVVTEIQNLEEYTPSLLALNCKETSEELRKIVDYDQIMTSSESVHIELVNKMAMALSNKLNIANTKGKVFLKTTNPKSVATILHEGEILKFSQSEMLFASRLEIPMWTTLILEAPLKALITVIPLKENISSSIPVYRALINGIGELQENELRRLVNKSLEEPKEVSDEEEDGEGEDPTSSP
tara:strand:+ start:306950 stop:308539 length:1590 start_codon:yes stop_codon:yes gene_type:complete